MCAISKDLAFAYVLFNALLCNIIQHTYETPLNIAGLKWLLES